MASKSDKIKKRREELMKKEIPIEAMVSPLESLVNIQKDLNDNIIERADNEVQALKEQINEREPSSGKQIITDGISKNEESVSADLEEKHIDTVPIPEKQPSRPAENVSQKKNDSKTGSTSMKRKLSISHFNFSELSTWGANIKNEAIDKYNYYAVTHEITKYDLINSILLSEEQWQERHPEFPEKSFVMENIRKKERGTGEDYSKLALAIHPDRKIFLKKAANKCGMKMYDFIGYLINLYCE